MAQIKWQVSKISYCDHIGQEILLETEVIIPPDQMPDQPPRIVAHRCSNAMVCNQLDKMSCALCGTNPDYSPV